MNQMLRLTQVIYSSWIVGGDEDQVPPIPTGPGVFDRALKRVCEAGKFPEWARNSLHFVESSSGLNCLEAAGIQRLATEAKIVSDPNPSYTRSKIEVSKEAARYLLARLGIAEEEAKDWGAMLRVELQNADTLIS